MCVRSFNFCFSCFLSSPSFLFRYLLVPVLLLVNLKLCLAGPSCILSIMSCSSSASSSISCCVMGSSLCLAMACRILSLSLAILFPSACLHVFWYFVLCAVVIGPCIFSGLGVVSSLLFSIGLSRASCVVSTMAVSGVWSEFVGSSQVFACVIVVVWLVRKSSILLRFGI